MGMYTELALNVRLNHTTPTPVIQLLQQLTNPDLPVPSDNPDLRDIPDHPFFHTERWEWCMKSEGSGYFHGATTQCFTYDDITRCWSLLLWTNIKNYSNEWETLLDFLRPYISNGGYSDLAPEHIGHMRYEEDDLPTLIFIRQGRLIFTNQITLPIVDP